MGLKELVRQQIDQYFDELDGEMPQDLYDLVVGQVEHALLEAALAQSNNNQSKAAEMLGISRGTLRTRMKLFGLLS
ncbi:MAG: Fis family transcriptional regulator [Litorivicinaceae bacterium]|jgi:Fis family transcriptional regulator|nr:Fis family transcriptional regulator [Litorivicinus sp.]MCH1501512.1 DNA-binding transcriptional regulator Fis [Litorivicinaceae bacterium]NBR74914.1 Fis family transcriptional regulator [Gammaproteobacteria bacterium]MDA8664981.1 DNA-binding transcriptional regulator Fis [Litorivicinaceae bacterium]MDA9007212.1 DNA-binding transcriptional regulator Fis [Litorivicinus sp.]|tara:strand:- start:417 stop:644 length:228 start_codon:yes stop_codon:yes gene_type:complete